MTSYLNFIRNCYNFIHFKIEFSKYINAKFDLPTKTKQLDLENNNLLTANTIYQDIGFSVYAQNGNAIWNYYDTDGSLKRVTFFIYRKTYSKEKS